MKESISYDPATCACIHVMDESKGDLCDHPDHQDNKGKGARDPLTAECREALCPKLRLDAFHSTVMKSGHMISIRDFKLSNPICPIHGKRAIISEPFDEIGVQRWFCIDCVAHAIYDREIKTRVEQSQKAILTLRNKRAAFSYSPSEYPPVVAEGCVGLLDFILTGDSDKILKGDLRHVIKDIISKRGSILE